MKVLNMEGTIKAFAPATNGVNIDEKWYNAAEIWQFAGKMVVGTKVNFSAKDDKLLFIQDVSKSGISGASDQQIQARRDWSARRDARMIKMSSLKNAIEYVKIIVVTQPEAEFAKTFNIETLLEIAKKIEKHISGE